MGDVRDKNNDSQKNRVAHFAFRRKRRRRASLTTSSQSNDGNVTNLNHSPRRTKTYGDEFDFEASLCSSPSSINVGIKNTDPKRLKSPQKIKLLRSRRIQNSQCLLHRLYIRSISRIKDPCMLCKNKNRQENDYRAEWFPEYKRFLPFRCLMTSPNDAILALDRSGSFAIAIGDGRRFLMNPIEAESQSSSLNTLDPCISFRLYAIPSNAGLEQSYLKNGRSGPKSASTHIISIPLLMQQQHDENDAGRIINCATTRVQLLLSDDFSLGVALLHHAVREDDGYDGTFCIFPILHKNCARIPEVVKSYRFPHSILHGVHSHTLRHLLWRTKRIPLYSMDSSKNKWDKLLHCGDNGYIFLNDEADGFRIFWIHYSSINESEVSLIDTDKTSQKNKPKRDDIITRNHVSAEVFYSESITGNPVHNDNHWCDDSSFDILSEAYLHMDALLSEIIQKRKKTILKGRAMTMLPDYYYNLISIVNDRTMSLIIVFENPMNENICIASERSSFGVFIFLDLIDQSYSEKLWLQKKGSKDLQNWCNELALNEQMKKMHVGPFCTQTDKSFYGFHSGIRFHERNEEAKSSIHKWEAFHTRKNMQPPGAISISSLYPHCDLVTNDAVVNTSPVKSIDARDFPVKLVYNP